MRQLFAMGVAIALASSVGVANAQQPAEDPGAQAKQYFERGMAHFQLEEYDQAIAKWEDGFRIKPVPEFLYNIAQAYRLSKRSEKALAFYQKYLRMNPKAGNRADVEQQIKILTKIVEQEHKAATAPPNDAIGQEGGHQNPETRPETTPETRPSTPPETRPETNPETKRTELTTPPTPQPSSPPAAEKPIYKKGWFWGVMAGAVVVVVGVSVGVAVGTSSSGDSTRALPDLRF
jgi:tetratricopeptide (TPR) repeat protein